MTRPRRLIAMAFAVVAALAVSAVVGYQLSNRSAPAGPRYGIGGPINLVDMNGGRFTTASLGGKPYAVFFGFTRCPNVCPTTLSDLTRDLEQLGPLADKLTVLFVTIDPERDTPESLKAYLSAFDPHIIGLAGTPEEIAATAKAYRVYYEKVPTDGGDYTMNHTATVFLMNGKGDFTGTISLEEEQPARIAKLKRLAEEG